MDKPNLGGGSFDFDKFKGNARDTVIVLLGTTSVEGQRRKIQHRASVKNLRRENRRDNLRKEALSIEQDSSLTSEQKETRRDDAMISYTTSSLDDDQPESNVLQDLQITRIIPEGTQGLTLLVSQDRHIPLVPTSILPAKGRSFNLYMRDSNGTVRSVNNQVMSLAIPLDEIQLVDTKSVAGSTGILNDAGSSSPFASLSSAVLRNLGNTDNKEVTVTTLDLQTNKIETLTNNNNSTNETSTSESTVEKFFQGVEPLSTSTGNSIRLQTQPMLGNYVVMIGLTLFQLLFIYTVVGPSLDFCKNFIKKNFLNRNFKKSDKKDVNGQEKTKEDPNPNEKL